MSLWLRGMGNYLGHARRIVVPQTF